MIEVRLPISPTPSFLNRVRLIGASLRQWYDVLLCPSCYPPPDPNVAAVVAFQGWSLPSAPDFASWAGTRAPYMATIADTWRGPFHGDHILHLDADVLPIARFDELLAIDALCGVPAHHGPFSPYLWGELFRAYGLPPPAMDMPYSGFGAMFSDPAQAMGPRGYYNSGVIFGPRRLFEQLAPAFADAVRFLRATLADQYWVDQLSFTLAIHASGIPTRTLGIEFNFPNRASFDRTFPQQLAKARFIHAMDTGTISRDADFESDDAIAALIARTDLTGSNAALRDRLAAIHPVI